MKKIYFFAIASIISVVGHSQTTASGYYLPLCIDNYTELYASVVPPSTWSPRTLRYKIIGRDTINGAQYFIQEGRESGQGFNQAFHYLWLKENANGEIILKAIGNESGNIDSAFVLTIPMPLFPNDFLTVGFSRLLTNGTEGIKDSVISTTASINGFSNCLEIRTWDIQNGIVQRTEDQYYAPQIGLVHINRFYPQNEAYTANYVSHNNTSTLCGIGVNEVAAIPFDMYPNPVAEKLRIDLGETELLEANITDLQGRRFVADILEPNTVNTANLSAGMYILTVVTKTGTFAQRFIKI